MRIAIIGAGISGLACARQLHERGHAVTVFEKSHDVGGRMATHATDLGDFDCGAQFFTALSEEFKKEVSSWRAADRVAPWHGKLVRLENGAIRPARPSSLRFVAVPDMGALTRHLAADLDVRTGHAVMHLEATGKTGRPQWGLKVLAEGATTKMDEGPFDAVVVATPANMAAHLLKSVPTLAGKAEKTGFVSCWALMLSFQQPLELAYDGAWVDHPRLTWIARDASKPDRSAGERWMALARVEWSAENLKETPERVRDKLLKAFQEATGTRIQPVQASVRLWTYAQSIKPLAKSCLWEESQGVGACGDWFTNGLEGGGQIEHAFLSGISLAARIDT